MRGSPRSAWRSTARRSRSTASQIQERLQLQEIQVATEADIAEMTADPDVEMEMPHRSKFLAEWKELLASRKRGLDL